MVKYGEVYFLKEIVMESLLSVIGGSREREFTLPSGKLVKIKEMDGWCEDLLASEAFQSEKEKQSKFSKRSNKAFDKVLAYCTTYLDGCGENVTVNDINNLYSYDYLFLAMAMRIVSRGDEYKVEINCEECGAVNVFIYQSLTEEILDKSKTLQDLNSIQGVDVEKEEYHAEVFDIIFVLKFLKSKDQNVLEERIKLDGNRKNNSHIILMHCKGWYKKGADPSTIQPLNIDLIRKMPMSYTTEIKDRIEDIKFGPDITVQSYCRNCNSYMEGSLMTRDFFLANSRKKKYSSCGNSNAEEDMKNSCQCQSQQEKESTKIV